MKEINGKLVKNKSNGQFNISLSKKQISKELLADLDNAILNKLPNIKIKMRGF